MDKYNGKVPKHDYQCFLRIFDTVRETERLGRAFCTLFDIKDAALYYLDNNHEAARLVEDNYVDWHPECRT